MYNKLSPVLFFWLFAMCGYNSFLYLVNKQPQQTQLSSLEASTSTIPSFDAHVHLRYGGTVEESAAELNRYLDETGLEGMFVLSEAYHGASPTQESIGLIGEHASSTRQPKNAFTGQVLSLVRGQSIGLCGYSPLWPDGVEVISDCLLQEKMRGLKLRSSRGNYNLQDAVIKERLRDVLRAHGAKIRFVLAHMADGYSLLPIGSSETEVTSALEHDRQEVETFIQLAMEFPQIQFIFAHSIYSDVLVEHAAQYRDEQKTTENSLENLWIETSTSLSSSQAMSEDWLSNRSNEISYNSEFQQRLINSWRRFGMTKVLFGSDILLGGAAEKTEQQTFNVFRNEHQIMINILGQPPQLTASELEQLTRQNWQMLLNSI